MTHFDKVVLFDTETVGVKPNYIISLSYRYYENGELKKVGEILCNPKYQISPSASQVNGFTYETVKDYPSFDEEWIKIEPYFRDSVWIAHNAPFDCRALRTEFHRYKLLEPHHYELDTLAISRVMIRKPREVQNHKLITLCKYFGFEINEEDFHGSDYDILMTDKVFTALQILNKDKFDNEYDELFIPKEREGQYTINYPTEDIEDNFEY